MAKLTAILTTDVADFAIRSTRRENIADLRDYLNALNIGAKKATVLSLSQTAATATVTFSDPPVADDILNIGARVFTAVASPAGETQFALGATAADAATNLAAKVNAVTAASTGAFGCYSASAVGAVVTFTCLVPGLVGNAMRFEKSGATMTLSGANFTGGTETSQNF